MVIGTEADQLKTALVNRPLTALAAALAELDVDHVIIDTGPSPDLLHTLTYKGMGIFPAVGSDLSIQLWVVARALEAPPFLLAALHLGRPLRFSAWFWLWAFASAAAVLLVSIWPLQIFPQCFVEGEGLTPFKIASEYLIAAVLAGAACLLWRRWDFLGPRLGGLLLTALVFNIASELSFTHRTDDARYKKFG